MKNNRVKKLMTSAVILLAGLAFATSAYAQESNTQEKVRLMIAAVQAKDSGDLYGAKEKLEELLKIVPTDKSIQTLLVRVNEDIATQEATMAAERKAAVLAAQTKVVQSETPVVDANLAELEEAEAAVLEGVVVAESQDATKEEVLLNQAELRKQLVLLSVETLAGEAEALAEEGNIAEASAKLTVANDKLNLLASDSPEVNAAKAKLGEVQAKVSLLLSKDALAAGRFDEAKTYAEDAAAKSADSTEAEELVEVIAEDSENPFKNKLESVSPDYVVRTKEINSLMKKGKIQYLYGDYDGARRTFRNIETLDYENMQAKTYLSLIATKMSEVGMKSYETTRKQLIAEIDNSWQLPQVYQGDSAAESNGVVVSPIVAKLDNIIIEDVNFTDVPLSRVINTLSALSVENDKSGDVNLGVNIALMGKDDGKTVSLALRNSPLVRILSLATQQAGYTYEIQDDVVLVVEGAADASVLNLDTEVFTINTQILQTRILGIKSDSSSSDNSDPFASSSSSSSSDAGGDDKSKALEAFFKSRGVQFGPGTAVSCTDSEISVTNTPKNIDRVRNILLRYSDIEQVEVEAKFMEVNQGALDMVAFNYNMARTDANGNTETLFATNNRLLSAVVSETSTSDSAITVSSPVYTTSTDNAGNSLVSTSYKDDSYAQNIPGLPSSINLAATAVDTANAVLGVINGFTADIIVNALSQEQGTDVLTAPKLTVMSGESANIKVAQQMFYPTEFSDVESEVGSSSSSSDSNSSSSAAGVTITPGTPSNFVEALIGVTMDISPVVEEDKSITIQLNPEVKEFEGFMEYGGVAVALSYGTTVTVPSGFIQPVFSIRSIDTKVCVFDGATIVLGGLVKEDVKTVNDGVPFLKDIPLLGTFFRSKGESRQKRNLVIFVTANRITPGGSLRNSLFSGVSSSSVYQNPSVRSPGGVVSRVKEVEDIQPEKN